MTWAMRDQAPAHHGTAVAWQKRSNDPTLEDISTVHHLVLEPEEEAQVKLDDQAAASPA